MSIAKLLIDDQPHQVLPNLAKAIGLNEAIFLQQLHYLLNYSKNELEGRVWVFNTYEQWQDIFGYWSVSTIRRTIENLTKLGLLVSTDKFNKFKMDKTKWYSIDYQRLANLDISTVKNNSPFVQNEQSGCSKWTALSAQNEQSNNHKNTQKNTTQDNTPLPPKGESAIADENSEALPAEIKNSTSSKKRSSSKIDYQAVMDLWNSVNEAHGSKLAFVIATKINERRKRLIKNFLEELAEPTLECVENYFNAFFNQARPFYFGETDKGDWKANFEYVIRPKVVVEVREGGI